MEKKELTIDDVREYIYERKQMLEWIERAVYGGGAHDGVPFERLRDVGDAAAALDDDLFSQMAAQDELDKHGRGCGGWLEWYHGIEGEFATGNEIRARRLVLVAEIKLLDDILRDLGNPKSENNFGPDIPDEDIPF